MFQLFFENLKLSNSGTSELEKASKVIWFNPFN